jgi:hypothetical protein
MILFWFQQEIKDKDNFYELVHVYKIYETILYKRLLFVLNCLFEIPIEQTYQLVKYFQI